MAIKTYTYTIYDADPRANSGVAWDTHEDVEIEASSDAEALDAVRDIIEGEAVGLSRDDGYAAGDRLYALVWDADDVVVGTPSYALTDEDLGIEETDQDEDGVQS